MTIDKLCCLYKSPDPRGDFLCQPLKKYHHFFTTKSDQSRKGCHRTTYRIIHLLTGLAIYPIGGILAGVGILVKLTDLHHVRLHNEGVKTNIKNDAEMLKTNLKHNNAAFLPSTPYFILGEEYINQQNVN